MTEHLDILTDDGLPTGKALSRAEVHEKGLWHRAAHIWIVNSKGELLLQKRSAKKISSPGLWDISAAGHLSAGESSLEGAVKEVGEEVGLTISPDELMFLGTTKHTSIQNNGTYINSQFSDIYLLRKDVRIEDLKLQESEVDEIRFIPWKELEARVKSEDSTLVPHPGEYPLLFDHLSKKFR